MSVLAVVTGEREAMGLTRLGYRFARALERDLVVLCLEAGEADGEARVVAAGAAPADLAPAPAAAVAELERLAGDGPAPDPGLPLPAPAVEVRLLPTRSPLAAVLAQVAAVDADYVLVAKKDARPRRGASLARKLFNASPAHTVLVRLAGDLGRCARVLVPTAGGPHAAVALSLGERLARAEGGRLTALLVEPPAGELAAEVGERLLAGALAEAGVETGPHVDVRVELAEHRTEAIRKVAQEGYDLLLLGASNAGTLRQQLFGTLPNRLLAGGEGLSVAAVRSRFSLVERIKARLGRWLDLTVPQMSREDRIGLYETLESGSRWSFDFMALISLSTAIATLGLLQSSAAVVIGAMLVAPLMTPILGAGLALVQGNLPLLRRAARAIGWGYLIALAIGLGGGFLVPLDALTPELLARGGPTLLDMGVAFFSGVAAAHCLGRPGLLAALPGVAIAAALVPPIATTGISLAHGARANAGGAALLFGTNVVAIILGAAATFYAAGVRGKPGASRSQRWVHWAFGGLLAVVVVLAIPLAAGMRGQGEEVKALERALAQRLETVRDVALVGVEERYDGGRPVLEVTVRAPAPIPPALARELAQAAGAAGARPRVRVRTEVAVEVE